MQQMLYAFLASTLVMIPASGLAQPFDIYSFDPAATGPWSEVGRTTLMVPKVPDGSIQLDGTISSAEYGGFVAVPVTPGVNAWILDFPEDRSWDGEEDSSFSFWLAHDSDNFYVAVDVKDDVVTSDDPNADFWRDDAVELVIDALNDRFDNNTDNSNDPVGGHAYVNFEGRFSAWDEGAGTVSSERWASSVDWKYGQNEDVFAHGQAVTGGWRLEVRLRKRLFESTTVSNKLANGYRMGFNIGLDDDDRHGPGTLGDGSRSEDLEIQYFWANRQRRSGFTAEFLDSLSAEEKQTRNYLFTLEPIIDQTGRLAHGGTGEILFGYDTPTTGDILFIASDAASPINADPSLIAWLQAKGYTVTTFTANNSTAEDLRAAAEGKDLVIISESIGSTSVLDPPGDVLGAFTLKDANVPIISFEAYMYDNAGWTSMLEDGNNDWLNWGNSGRSEVDTIGLGDARDSIYIRNPNHPTTAGFTGRTQVYRELYSFSFGVPSADAEVLASLQEDGSYPTLFVYEEGDTLVDGSVAPNKRIGLFLGQAANPTVNYAPDLDMLNEAGRTLLLNTIAWAIGGGGASEPTLSVARDGTSVVVTFSGGTLESAENVTGPWNPETGASPLTLQTTGTRKFLRVRAGN